MAIDFPFHDNLRGGEEQKYMYSEANFILDGISFQDVNCSSSK